MMLGGTMTLEQFLEKWARDRGPICKEYGHDYAEMFRDMHTDVLALNNHLDLEEHGPMVGTVPEDEALKEKD